MGENMTSLEQAVQRKKKIEYTLFDNFLLSKLGYQLPCSEETRQTAFNNFYNKMGGKELASKPTIERWFGIHGSAIPKRMQIFQMMFVLQASCEDLQDFLIRGIREPGVQINDYQETIFFYGIWNHLSYEKCMEHIRTFELYMDANIKIEQHHNTFELFQEFESKKVLEPSEFMAWMQENAAAFKGYSQTALDYLLKLKRTILKRSQLEVESYLDELLTDAGYYIWLGGRCNCNEKQGESIRKFVYGSKEIDADYRKEILKMTQILYFEEESNDRLISEVFSNSRIRNTKGKTWDISRMTKKHLSDLLNVASHKERDIHIAQALTTLYHMNPKEKCPAWILNLVYDCGGDELHETKISVVYDWISCYRRQYRNRCQLVQREDLLPLLLFVFEFQYMEMIVWNINEYDVDKAKEKFIILADSVLSACNMAKMSEQYQLDSMIIQCFQKDELYTYSDLLEVLQK